MRLLNNVSADTTGVGQEIHRLYRGHGDSIFAFYGWATSFGAGAIRLEVSPDAGTTWFIARTTDGAQAVITANNVLTVYVRPGFVRAVLTGATAPSGVHAALI